MDNPRIVMSHNVCKSSYRRGFQLGVCSHLSIKINIKGFAGRYHRVLVRSASLIMDASSRVQPAPNKNNGIPVLSSCLGARVLQQRAPEGCNYPLKSNKMDQKGVFFTSLASLTTIYKNEGVFPQNNLPLHPFFTKYLFLKVIIRVQVGCKLWCTLGALWVQAPSVVLTCTQLLQRNIIGLGQRVHGCS